MTMVAIEWSTATTWGPFYVMFQLYKQSYFSDALLQQKSCFPRPVCDISSASDKTVGPFADANTEHILYVGEDLPTTES